MLARYFRDLYYRLFRIALYFSEASDESLRAIPPSYSSELFLRLFLREARARVVAHLTSSHLPGAGIAAEHTSPLSARSLEVEVLLAGLNGLFEKANKRLPPIKETASFPCLALGLPCTDLIE